VVRKSSVFLIVPVLVLAAACSSSKSSPNASTPATSVVGTPSTSTASTAPASSGDAGSALTKLKAEVAALTQRPTKILDRPAFSKPFPTGKTIDVIAPSVPSGLIRATEVQDVGKLVGWKVKVLNAGNGADLAKITQAIQQAVVDKPDGVVISGFPNAIYQPQLKAFEAAKIPVVEEYTVDTTDESKGLFSIFGHGTNTLEGSSMAKYILADRSLNANTLYVNAPAYPSIVDQMTAFKATYASLCASCKFATLDIPAASIGIDVAARIVGYLTAHPNVDSIVYGFPDLATGATAALKAANIDQIKTSIVLSTSPALLNGLRSGEVGALTDAPPEWTYYVADVLARQFVSLPPESAQIDQTPIWIITKDTLPADADLNQQDFVGVPDYIDQFKKLWGR
jgi:ABC-type sugar transport system substrate-binding protein